MIRTERSKVSYLESHGLYEPKEQPFQSLWGGPGDVALGDPKENGDDSTRDYGYRGFEGQVGKL